MVYCDYTASGRSLHFIENYLIQLQRSYANTHTEDDITGRRMTQRLHEAEQIIKGAVNAGPQGRIIACGTGSTGAIDKFQQLVGIACPPATRQMLFGILGDWLGVGELDAITYFVKGCSPVVFVGPYEHHSNEVTWREGPGYGGEGSDGCRWQHRPRASGGAAARACLPGPAAHRLLFRRL